MAEELKQTMVRLPYDLWLEVSQINLKKKEKMNQLIIRLLTEYAQKSAK